MTCQDARQWLSDLLDEALEADRRVEVDAHLASCADCRVELDRLAATVGALRGLDHPRAPASFVDRVVQRAYPVPWYRRLCAWLFLPFSIKLPVEAAAVVVIAGLAVLVWQRTPEFRDTVRLEAPAPSAPSTAAVEPTTHGPSPAPPPAGAASRSPRTPLARNIEWPPSPAPRAPKTPVAPEETVASTPPAPESKAESAAREEPAPRALAQAARPAAQADRSDTRARSAPQTVRRTLALVPSTSDLAGRLIVRDRDAATAVIAELLSTLGGQETGRSQDDSDTVLDVQIPEARYDDFIRGLNRLGWLTTSGRANVLPLDPPQVRLTIRLAVRP